jgi:replicative DNA helicase
MNSFNEIVFVWALMKRSSDVKKFANIFKSDWLRTAPLRPIYEHIIAFTKKEGIAPEMKTIKALLTEEFGEQVFESRYKPVLKEVEKGEEDNSYVVYTLSQAKEAAISRSLQEMISSQRFLQMFTENSGSEILENIEKWRIQFFGKHEDLHMTFLDAVEQLKEEREFMPTDFTVQTGIDIVDNWCSGGLRPKNLGIWLAPTGHGKTSVMVFSSHNIAVHQDKRVWFISNEEDMNQITERFLTRFSGKKWDMIREDPLEAILSPGMDCIRSSRVHKNLMLSYMNRDASADDIESELSRFETIWGWKPQAIVIDYMERMRPNAKGFTRDKSWIYYGEIAKDLSRMAKSQNCVIWTAAQTNRGGFSAEEITGEHAQGSIQHLQEAAAVISLRQPGGVEEGKQVMEFQLQKLRQSKMTKKPVKLECDLSTMSFSNVEYYQEEVDRSENIEPTPPPTRKKRSKFRPNNF